ncbi:naked cuticle-like [Homarus americanus]|uniref:Protein naked cuticle homolog n=1 Tax=Homarus americanus TaxID=6706 RepID=A0A8J5JP23_HOMAM|nr:naked cuticle-like [Homarus americanus]
MVGNQGTISTPGRDAGNTGKKRKTPNTIMAQEEGCGRSDTETLVRACEDDLLPTPTPTPTPHAHPHPHPGNTRSHLTPGTYVEEVSCDVSVAAGEADRQEFSFTLYDFDGHGKVTKDDIAGLVRTIYEAVGSSLSLPPSGSRTIRVKLTVAPENCRGRQQDFHHQETCEGKKGDEEGDPCEHPSGRSHRRRKARRRSTSLQRHELLQIIQANMEKNNLFYTPLHRRHDHHHHDHHHDHHHNRRRRRHGCGCDHSGSPPDPAEVKARLLEPECPCRHTHYHSHTHGPTNTARSMGCRRHNRSHSHDLSHDSPHVFRYHLLDKTFQPLPPSNTPDQPPSPPMAHNPHSHHQQQYQHQTRHYHHHHRSRSFDAGDTQGSSPRGRSGRLPRSQQQSQTPPQKQSKEQQQSSTQSKQEHQGGNEVSPHHTKHRHREADHARAMAQVVAWLERGSLLDSQKSPTTPESGNGGIGGVGGSSGSGACREQTHHVHQHIHHHYHHYAEKQPPPLLI